jgi:MFS family permease
MAGRRMPFAVFALGLTSFFTDVGSEMIFPLLPAFLVTLGAGAAFLGLVEGAADALSSLLKLASGELVDRSERKKPLVLLGYGIAGLVRPLAAFATAPWHVLGIRLTDRVGKGIRSAPRDVLLAAAAPPDQVGRAFGLHRAMDHAGAVVGPLLAAALLGLGLSMREVFLAAVVPGALAMVALVLVREPGATSRVTAAVEAPIPARGRRLPPPLRRFLVALGLFALGNASDAFLLLRARELGVAAATLPLLWAAFHVVKLVSSWLGGAWADRVPRTRLVVLGWCVYAVTYVGFALARDPWHVWALFLLYGTFFGLTEPAEKALVKDLAPPEVRGRAFGAYHFVVGASALPAGLLTGWLWQTFGARMSLQVGATLAAAAAITLVLARIDPPEAP